MRMSLLLNSSTALLLLPLLTHLVTSDFPFNKKPHVTDVMMSMLKIQQVKERILRGLNMTAAPRMLTPDSSRVKVRKTMQDAERQPNVSMILSEATGPHTGKTKRDSLPLLQACRKSRLNGSYLRNRINYA